eukprot:UN04480
MSPATFEEDYRDFLVDELGYDYKYQDESDEYIRCATFWKPELLSLKTSFCKRRNLNTQLTHKHSGKDIIISNLHSPSTAKAQRKLNFMTELIDELINVFEIKIPVDIQKSMNPKNTNQPDTVQLQSQNGDNNLNSGPLGVEGSET